MRPDGGHLVRLALLVLAGLLVGGCAADRAHRATRPASTRIVRREQLAPLSRCGRPPAGRLGYAWPVRPFHAQHPIRGNFGDPRTVSMEEFGIDGPGLAGDYSFHNGVDISARPGTPVYPVVSGIAHLRAGNEVTVRAGSRVFQYRHLTVKVRDDEHVVAGVTVLGLVRFPAQHVHLSEIDHERVTNPALHLRPYRDRTAPIVRALEFRDGLGHTVSADSLSGTVSIIAWVDDSPPVAAPGAWQGLPVAPARVRWKLVDATGATRVARIVADFRRGEPLQQRFWNVYAPGTYQNFPVFDNHFYWHQAGRFLFQLTPARFDTRRLGNGTYTLQVEAGDICGNRGTLTQQVRITNPPPRYPATASSPVRRPVASSVS